MLIEKISRVCGKGHAKKKIQRLVKSYAMYGNIDMKLQGKDMASGMTPCCSQTFLAKD